ncbi:MAG: response regulator, partial [Desulfatiglandales bacterium]
MNKKIMVVDNHPLILKFMKDLLVKEGYQVSTAKDGLSALDVLKTYTPDVIFIDLIMPNINGEKLCQIIRSMPRLKDAGIIILSAIAAEQDLDYAALGANACVAKGSLDQMAQHIFSALDQLDQRTSNSMPGTVIGLEGVNSREITKELLSYEKHSDVILNSMSEGILEVTTESRVVYANPAAIALIGMPEEKVIASDVTQLFHETDRQKIRELLKKTETISQIVSDDSTVILSGRQVSMKVLPVTDGDSKAVIVILNDVSERKRIEEQLQLAQKIEAIATLAGGIAHDFNNLLMTIQGNISVMLLDIDPSHPHYERLKNTEKQVQSGAKLTRQLLGYARKSEYEVRPIKLNQLVEETAETFGRTKKEITIHRDLCEDLFAIQADEGQIEQVLLNLFVNAADAMPDGGKLFLKTMKTNHKEMMPMVYDLKPGHYVR